MILPREIKEQLQKELSFAATKSSGPGGQNVNKVNTRVELRFSILNSALLTEDQKEIILLKLANRINQNHELILTSDTERSQLRNKDKVTELFLELIEKALTPAKKRRKTKPTKASKQKRLEQKKLTSVKKQLRKPPKV